MASSLKKAPDLLPPAPEAGSSGTSRTAMAPVRGPDELQTIVRTEPGRAHETLASPSSVAVYPPLSSAATLPGDFESAQTLVKPPSSRAPPLAPRGHAAGLPIVDPGHYELAGEFAKGGIGRLLRAQDQRLQRWVAVKELIERRPYAEQRFVREALLTARLEHPSIVPVHEAGRWPTGEPFYTMKLVSGRALDTIIDEARTLEQRLALLPHVLAVAEAIAYAHSQRIIHRDLKPANVLVGEFGETLVIDWGLAKDLNAQEEPEPSVEAPSDQAPLSSSPKLTLEGAVMGTPAYMPPEQALGLAVDERADVYSLGAILYHVLAGATPYDAETIQETLKQVAELPPPDLEERQPGVPRELAAIVHKALARIPDERYPTAQELAGDLRRFQTGQIVGAHKYSWAERMRRFARRYKAALLVALAALVLLLVGAVLGIQGIRSERDIARQERDRAERERTEADIARREAVERADELTLIQARGARDVDPNATLAWLKKLSPAFSHWGAARTIAADARSRGIARVLRGHTGGVNEIDLSPDGRTLALASDDHRVSLWDLSASTGRFLSGHTDEVWTVMFSPDGQSLLTGGKDTTLHVWNASTGQGRVLAGHHDAILQSFFLPGGTHVVSRGQRDAVRLWDLATGESREIERPDDDRGLAVSPDGSIIAWTARGELVLWDMAKSEARRFRGQTSPATVVLYSPTGELIATGEKSGTVRLWSAQDGTIRVLSGHTGRLSALDFSPDGKHLASGALDGTLRVWDVATGRMRTWKAHEASIRAVRFSRQGDRIATGAADRTVRLWDIDTGKSRVLRGFADAVPAVLFSKDGGLLAGSSWDHTVRLWDIAAAEGDVLMRHQAGAGMLAFFHGGKCVASAGQDGVIHTAPVQIRRAGHPVSDSDLCGHLGARQAHDGPVQALVAWPSGGRIASAGPSGTIKVWEAAGGDPILLRGHERAVVSLAIAPGGKSLASGGNDGTVRLWDVDRREGRIVQRHDGEAKYVAFSPDGALLASGGKDAAVRLFDIAQGKSRELRHRGTETFALAFSPDGKILAASDDNHKLALWDIQTSRAREVDHPTNAWRIAFIPGGGSLVTAGESDLAIRIVDTGTGEVRSILRGNPSVVVDVAPSPDGKRVAAAYRDGTVELWDLESTESRLIPGHSGEVGDVAFSPDGRFLLSAGADGTVRLFWDDLPTDPAELRAWIDKTTPDTIELLARPGSSDP